MQRGQATVEWLGVVALVAVVLAAAVALVGGAAAGQALAGSVVREMQRALCIVRGGICDFDQRPCVVASGLTDDEAHINLGFVRLGRHEAVLLEHRSDGTVLATYVHDWQAGFDAGLGADAWVSAFGHQIALSASARVAAIASLGGGDVYAFASEREADRGMALLSEGMTPPGGPVQRVSRAGETVSLDGQAGADGLASGSLHLEGSYLDATSVDARTGRRTHVITGDLGAAGLLEVGDQTATASGGVQRTLTITTDARGRPLELSVAGTGQLSGAASLPDALQPLAGRLLADAARDGGLAAGRRWSVERHLDLTDPDNLAAARGLLNAMAHPDPLTPLARTGAALEARLDDAGVTSVRTYDLAQQSSGASGHLAVGAKVGAGVVDHTEDARLISAAEITPGGLTEARPDCVA